MSYIQGLKVYKFMVVRVITARGCNIVKAGGCNRSYRRGLWVIILHPGDVRFLTTLNYIRPFL